MRRQGGERRRVPTFVRAAARVRHETLVERASPAKSAAHSLGRQSIRVTFCGPDSCPNHPFLPKRTSFGHDSSPNPKFGQKISAQNLGMLPVENDFCPKFGLYDFGLLGRRGGDALR